MLLLIDQGENSDYSWPITDADDVPVSLVGYTAKAQARASVSSSTVLYEWNTTNGGIVLTTGKLDLKTTPAISSAFAFTRGVFDVELVAPGGTPVIKVASGVVLVKSEVTR